MLDSLKSILETVLKRKNDMELPSSCQQEHDFQKEIESSHHLLRHYRLLSLSLRHLSSILTLLRSSDPAALLLLIHFSPFLLFVRREAKENSS
jgi:hypothetical protein